MSWRTGPCRWSSRSSSTPVHGGREPGLNILKDTRRFLKELTDIVRGEHIGSISYQAQRTHHLHQDP